ncbi:MAG: c-type cytochrome [Thermoleophilaceae bacterium]|jgi:cytochrome c553|nr:c-type cytochrome [Thermoleophilaceae bacterium]MBA3838786.1 c-type cytochrome [Thermoleophilaceae bacterium]MDQ3241179.1 c-type cytochrome [Actinomycetota bacterium]MDQ3319405.1 c-type cytochrome [Actinomycetota bacterium]MDQ3356982.1 c-type cytochrome [Actinomycetota bacterium]
MSVWVWIFLVPWVVLGIAAVFVAFSGGQGRARKAYLTGGSLVKVGIPALYVLLGLVVPAAVIASQQGSIGGTESLGSTGSSKELEEGKELFRENCAACHSLGAIQAKGVTGPNLDRLGAVDEQRVLNAIKDGGTGKLQMPAGILDGENAEAVAAYVARTAGQ